MVDLIARTPAQGALPVSHGPWRLSEVVPDTITAVMPRTAGADPSLPAPNRITRDGESMTIWAGHNLFLVLNAASPVADAASVDHSDAWAVFDLTGPAGDAVLARLCPIDTRPARFAPGQTARTLLGHMNASVTRLADDVLRIMVARSMAQTAVHDLSRAMEHAAR